MLEALQREWHERINTPWTPRTEEFQAWLVNYPAEVLLYRMRSVTDHLKRERQTPEQFIEDELVLLFESFLERSKEEHTDKFIGRTEYAQVKGRIAA
jgi:hypothetical protein